MMSASSSSFFLPQTLYHHPQHPHQFSSYSSRHSPPYTHDLLYDTDSTATQFLEHRIDALFPSSSGDCIAPQPLVASSALHIDVPIIPTPTQHPCDAQLQPQTSIFSAPFASDLADAHYMSMGEVVGYSRAPKRARTTHQRTPSASTVASNGPASPYSSNSLYPQIANTEVSPNSPLQFTDHAYLGKSYPNEHFMSSGSYMPASTSNAPHTFGMKGFSFNNSIDDVPDFVQSSRLSMSTNGNNSPATPLSGSAYGEALEGKNGNGAQHEYRQPPPQVQLYRTESQAYQDELYDPANTYTSTPSQMPATKVNNEYLSPRRNMLNERLNERLQVANQARSASPLSNVSRERSPFRESSPFAASGDWRNVPSQMGTAAGMRQRQKEQTEQAELARNMPQLPREPTKTISPKDALLDYTDTDQPPLFQDSIPAGYRQHNGGVGSWQNEFVPPPGSSFGNLTASTAQPQMNPFRASPGQGFATGSEFNFMPLPPSNGSQAQMQATSFQPNDYSGLKMNSAEGNPEFAPSLVTMESSLSENGPAQSSQESGTIPATVSPTSAPRPADTRANTGSYQCPYHGCSHRYETANELTRHKKDYHRMLQAQRQASREATSSTGREDSHSTPPRSSESPEPSESGLTAAEIAARNSQTGPHKCTRINPSTGKPCNTIFSRPYDLTRHEDTIHNNRKQKVRCPVCREEKTFSRHDALTRHMRVVHPEMESFGKRGRRGE